MRDLKFRAMFKFAAVLTVLVVFSFSCKKDEMTADYVGKWMTVKPIAGTHGYVSVNYSLSLTDHSFTETFHTGVGQYPSQGSFVTNEGSVTISGKIMKLVVHKIGFSTYNSSTATASEPYETHSLDDDDFGFSFGDIGMATSNHQAEYDIVDNQLIPKIDYNRDGAFSDHEKSIYAKQ